MSQVTWFLLGFGACFIMFAALLVFKTHMIESVITLVKIIQGSKK